MQHAGRAGRIQGCIPGSEVIAMRVPAAKPVEVVYPESDGQPMGEGDLHRWWSNRIIERLERHFVGQDVYVTGNMMVYYVEGEPDYCICPDVFVVKACTARPRIVYKVWEEGKVPHFAMETTSESSRRDDPRLKRQLYSELGIKEYFLYDPSGTWLTPALQAFSLVKGIHKPLPGSPESGFVSRQLGIVFQLEEGELVMTAKATGKRLLSGQEYAADLAARLAEQEAQIKALQQKLARLRDKGKD